MPVGVEYDVTSCDLGVFVDQAAEIAGRGPARTTDEPPWLVGGRIDGEHWSVVVTYRAQRVRIISARRSRKEQVALPPQASLVARVAGDATANRVRPSGAQNGATPHQSPQIPGSGDFLPNFLPRQAAQRRASPP
jgi:uncharacterized DUF497 family protein